MELASGTANLLANARAKGLGERENLIYFMQILAAPFNSLTAGAARWSISQVASCKTFCLLERSHTGVLTSMSSPMRHR